jgi:hypothetical protein
MHRLTVSALRLGNGIQIKDCPSSPVSSRAKCSFMSIVSRDAKLRYRSAAADQISHYVEHGSAPSGGGFASFWPEYGSPSRSQSTIRLRSGSFAHEFTETAETYTVGEPFDSLTHEPYAMHLEPNAKNETFGRAGFLMQR